MATHKSGLGKGLESLFRSDDFVSEPQADAAEESIGKLPLTQIEPNKNQPRKVFDPEAMRELTASIAEHGVLTPITVRKIEDGTYQIIAGERRWRAARAAGLTEIPAYLIEADDRTAMELALIENLQRQDLNPIEEAEGYEQLMREFGLTQDEAAKRVGKSRPAVANALRLLALPAPLRQMVVEGKLSGGHARAVLSIQDEALRLSEAPKMAEMSVRKAEAYAKKLNQPVETPAPKPFTVDYTAALARELESVLGRRVVIEQGKKSGTLSLEFYNPEDLERLSEGLRALSL
jgi:ParB family chromosome partitioning protein